MEAKFQQLIRRYTNDSLFGWINNQVHSPGLVTIAGTMCDENAVLDREFSVEFPDSAFAKWFGEAGKYAVMDADSRMATWDAKCYYSEMRKHRQLSEEGFIEKLQLAYDLVIEDFKKRDMSPLDLFRQQDPFMGSYKDQYDLVMKMRDICLEYKRTSSLASVVRPPVEIAQSTMYEYASHFPYVDLRVKNGSGSFMVSLGAEASGVVVSGDNGQIVRPCSFFHEYGHALYQNRVLANHTEIGLAGLGFSMGLHESSALLNEIVQKPWNDVVNHDKGSLIRVGANKVDYVLHIALRMEIEHMLFTEQIKFADVPRVWNELAQAYFNQTPKDSWEGWLQDMHWAYGLFGYWATYAVGVLKAIEMNHLAKNCIKVDTVLDRVTTTNETVLPIIAQEYGYFREYDGNILNRIFPDKDKTLGTFTDYLFENFQLV